MRTKAGLRREYEVTPTTTWYAYRGALEPERFVPLVGSFAVAVMVLTWPLVEVLLEYSCFLCSVEEHLFVATFHLL
jgi:hypothetical protein